MFLLRQNDKKLKKNGKGSSKNALENKKWERRKRSGRCRGQRRGEENRRGMLCWRTGRGKPQEGVRGREVERERSKKKMGRERPDQGAVEAKVSCERRKDSLVCVLVCVTPEGGIHLYVCLYRFTYNCLKNILFLVGFYHI